MHVIAAKAVCFKEALQPEFKQYAQQIISNAKTLADGLVKNGFDIVSGGTDNHLMLVDLRKLGVTGKELEHNLDEVGITCNKNAIPFDPEKPNTTSGVRLGTPAATSRGLVEADFTEIADIIGMVARDFEGNKAEAIARVKAITDKYPLY
jgi:glycine hydroxymethyltransferase